MRDLHAFDKDNIKEEIFLEIFELLNKEELDTPKATLVNLALGNLIAWIRTVMSYHILVHPYRVRNTQTIRPESDLH